MFGFVRARRGIFDLRVKTDHPVPAFGTDSCFLSASCVIKNINFDVFIQAEKDYEILLLPAKVYQGADGEVVSFGYLINQILASAFPT